MNTDELIKSHIPLAETLAAKKKRKSRKTIYYEELESAALTGLVDAASRYETEKGPFPNFAARRINGEMEDYIRDLNWNRYIPVKMDTIDDALLVTECDGLPDAEKVFGVAMKLLPEGGRQMFRWYYHDKLTMHQIGERLGISDSMVSIRMKGYRDLLRKRHEEILKLVDAVE